MTHSRQAATVFRSVFQGFLININPSNPVIPCQCFKPFYKELGSKY